MVKSSNSLWTDEELVEAIDAYVFLLRAERLGIRQRGEIATGVLLKGALRGRNDASVRYRMRNISSVVSEFGIPVLSTYSPAERVGARVAARIKSILADHEDFNTLLKPAGSFSLAGGIL